ncbi:hypothetical protein [Amycolatopsis sp. NPDC003861]
MDQQSLRESSQRWMHAALDAFGHGEALDFAVHHAGVGLEHLLKAYLWSLHPALVLDAAHLPSLLHAVGYGDRSSVHQSRAKSIGLKAAFDRTRMLLMPKVAVTEAKFEPVVAARNGVAHVGSHDSAAARDVIGICIRVATPVLTELAISPRDYWDQYIGLVEELAEEHINELRLAYEAKTTRARRTFQQRFDELAAREREGLIAAIAASDFDLDAYGIQVDCPVCTSKARLDGTNKIVRDVGAENATEDSAPLLVFYPDYLRCAVCGLELMEDELELADLDQPRDRNVENPWDYIEVDEDLAYESAREERFEG